MCNFLVKLCVKARMLREDHGQDLIEYALIAALIAMACVAAMGTLANSIINEFAKIDGYLT